MAHPSRPVVPPSLLREVYTVSRLNKEAKDLLENAFGLLWIEGEISNLAQPGSGHLYFCLKDGQAQIRCAFFRGNQRGLACRPRDGLQVLVRARVGLYEGRGEYQLVVEHLEEAGEGRLRRAFEALKLRLAAEGLFDAARKKRPPVVPRRIGVITSPTGAAIKDILTTLRRRFPALPVLVYPVPVQGEGAAEKIAAMIALASSRRDTDVLILARGGGSLEDLWPFNEEIVARALAACEVPVIAGIGHEIDYTIADLVADLRAPTPTGAAELASPDQRDWLARFGHYQERLLKLARRAVTDSQQRVDWLAARLLQRSPGARLQARTQSLRHVRERVVGAMRWTLRTRRARLERAAHTLNALSPLATLARGYAIVRHADTGEVVRDGRALAPDQQLEANFARGRAVLRVESTSDE